MTTSPVPPSGEPGAATRERLLDAAEKLFAAHGFISTSVRDITAEAACNVAAVNYHFGGKDKLYLETFRRRMVSMREERIRKLHQRLAAEDAERSVDFVLRAIVNAVMEPLTDQVSGPRVTELIWRELLDRRLPAEVFLDDAVDPTWGAYVDALREVCPDLDVKAARLCVQSIVGQVAHALQIRRLYESVPARRLQLATLEQLADHIVQFSLGGLEAMLREEVR